MPAPIGPTPYWIMRISFVMSDLEPSPYPLPIREREKGEGLRQGQKHWIFSLLKQKDSLALFWGNWLLEAASKGHSPVSAHRSLAKAPILSTCHGRDSVFFAGHCFESIGRKPVDVDSLYAPV